MQRIKVGLLPIRPLPELDLVLQTDQVGVEQTVDQIITLMKARGFVKYGMRRRVESP